MRPIITLFIAVLFTLTQGKLRGQTGTFFSTDNVLSNSLINGIYQDSRGFIWISTEDGLNRFDGVRFNVYRSKRGDKNSLKNNYVRTVFEDSKGNIWVGCVNGLMRYDRGEDKFYEIEVRFRKQVVETHITSIIETQSGEIVMTTSGVGIIRSKDGNKSFEVDEYLFPQLSSRYLVAIRQDAHGDIWIASENQGLNRVNASLQTVETYKAPMGIGSNQISSIAFSENNEVFIGTLTAGLFKFDKKNNVFTSIPYKNAQITLPIKSLLYDSQRGLLVGTDGRGIMQYDRFAGNLTEYALHAATFDFSRTKIHALMLDKAGNLWTGLFQKGVFLSPNYANKFQYWGAKSFYHNLIGSNCVMSVLRDENGVLWVGTDNDGIYAIDKNNNSRHWTLKNNPNGVAGTIMGMAQGNAGTLWLASYVDGLLKFDTRTGNHSNFKHLLGGLSNNTSANKAMCVARDNKGNVWVGTNGAGVLVFDEAKAAYIRQYRFYEEDSTGIANNWVNHLLNDGDTLMWIGTYGGVSSVDLRTNKITTYRTKNNILPGNIVYSILAAKNGKMWFGTTEGLAIFDPQTATSQHYTTDNGLPSNVICGILSDKNGDAWLSTHAGISKYIVSENRFVNHYAYDGLQGNEFSMGAVWKSADGELIFGGVGGVTAFYPSKIVDQRASIQLQLTGLYIFDKAIYSGQKSGGRVIIENYIMDVEKIKLNYSDNMFSLEFSTFDFASPERVHLRYKMEGLNEQWISTEQGVNRINFTNLNYGKYTLRIKAVMHDNESAEKVIAIIVYPPWYLSWYMRLLYFILFGVLAWGVYRFVSERIQHRQELLRREHAEKVNEGKLQFFINISHEIRTPMTLIISPLEKLIKENTIPELQQNYLLMYRNAQRILRLINQLLDVRKIDKGLMFVKMRETDMIGFIDDLMTTFDYQARKRSIQMNFVHDTNKLMVWVDLNNFDKVLVNILSNAFKFTPDNGQIDITLSTGTDPDANGPLKNYFEIIVSDTGIGIEEDKIERIFERFYQIDHSQGDANFGTGIGLHLARNLVELMHGVIFARNRNEVKGSEFVIRLPLGNSHLSNLEIENFDESKHKTVKTTINDLEQYANIEGNEPKTKPKTKYRILIVEDETDIRNYLRNDLAELYHVSECVNGKEALDFILREKPDMVISDVMMPEMDGVTLCKKMKANININHIPIILLTARSSDEDKAEGFEIGADAYVAKPFNLELLRKRIANILENRERLGMKLSDKDDNKALIKPVVLKSSDQVLLEKVIAIINNNIDNPDLNVEMLADGVGMSRVHMHRKLKELTNQSARDFIRTIRLQQAAELLSNQKLTVSEVAYALGFTNLSHFSSTFREFHGISPKEYGEKNRG